MNFKNKLEEIEYKVKNKFVNYDHLADRKLANDLKQKNIICFFQSLMKKIIQ